MTGDQAARVPPGLEFRRFLYQCLDEDKRAAELMARFYPPPWETADRGWMARVMADGPSFWEVTRLEQWPTMPTGAGAPDLGQIIGHIGRHDPMRVLAEVGAKQRIVKLHLRRRAPAWDRPGQAGFECAQCADEYPCQTLRLLALPYAGSTGYRPAWAPDQ